MFIAQKLVARNKARKSVSKFFEREGEGPTALTGHSPCHPSPKRRRDAVSFHSRWQIEEKFEKPCVLHPLLTHLTEKEFKGLWTTWVYLKGKCGLRKVTMTMVRVFDKMEKRKPAIKEVFVKALFMHATKNEMSTIGATSFDHAKLLATLLDMMICGHSHKHGDTLGINTIGCYHAELVNVGLNAEMWEIFGQCFSEIMISEDCVRAFPHASRAWNILIAGLTDRMRASFEQQLKKLKRRNMYSSTPNIMVPKVTSEKKPVAKRKHSKERPKTEPLRRRTIITPALVPGQFLLPLAKHTAPSLRELKTPSPIKETVNLAPGSSGYTFSEKSVAQPRFREESPKTEPLKRRTIIAPALFPGKFLLPLASSAAPSFRQQCEAKCHLLLSTSGVEQSTNLTAEKSNVHWKSNKERQKTEPLKRRTIKNPAHPGKILLPIDKSACHSRIQESTKWTSGYSKLTEEIPKTEPLRSQATIAPVILQKQFLFPIDCSAVSSLRHLPEMKPHQLPSSGIERAIISGPESSALIYKKHHFRRHALF